MQLYYKIIIIIINIFAHIVKPVKQAQHFKSES